MHYSLLHYDQSSSGVNPASYLIAIEGSIHKNKAVGAVRCQVN
jgi:hypothetical protein